MQLRSLELRGGHDVLRLRHLIEIQKLRLMLRQLNKLPTHTRHPLPNSRSPSRNCLRPGVVQQRNFQRRTESPGVHRDPAACGNLLVGDTARQGFTTIVVSFSACCHNG